MWNKILHFLREHALVWCWMCRSVYFEKDMQYGHNTLGHVVPLCPDCYDILFHPFSKGK